MTSYFEALAKDMTALGADGLQPYEATQYRSVYVFLHRASKRFTNPSELVRDETAKLQTRLGKVILDVLYENRGFTEMRWCKFCPVSEPRLLDNIRKTENTLRQQPVIVTDQGDPIALLKTMGDRTLYGLRTRAQFGVIAGCFSAAETRVKFDPYELEPSSLPWTVEIEDIDPVYPTRPSMFTVPVRQRIKLQTDFAEEAAVLPISHKQIVDHTCELAATAVTCL